MVIGDVQSNIVIQIYPGLSVVAMGTKFGTKWAITRLLLRDICEMFAFSGGLGLGYRILPTKFYPDRPLLPWQ